MANLIIFRMYIILFRSCLYLQTRRKKISTIVTISSVIWLLFRTYPVTPKGTVYKIPKSRKIPSVHFKPPRPLEVVTGYSISQKKQTLFLEFGALRKTIPAIILMSAGDFDLNWKINYTAAAIIFMSEQLEKLAQVNKNYEAFKNELSELNQKLGQLGFDKNNGFPDQHNNKNNIPNWSPFLQSLGYWYRRVKTQYDTDMVFEIDECSNRMRDLENQISHRIFQVQQGELCEQSTGILHFR